MEAEVISAVQNGSDEFLKGFLIGAWVGFGGENKRRFKNLV